MTQKRFALVQGGPKSLLVSWGFGWKDFVVRLDDHEVGRIDGGVKALLAGAKFGLPDGKLLSVRLVMEKGALGKIPALHLHVDGAPVPGSEAVPLPRWGYAFMCACGAILLAARGGLVAGALAARGAALCASIARDMSRSVKTRVALCAAVTAAAWTIFMSVVIVVSAWLN